MTHEPIFTHDIVTLSSPQWFTQALVGFAGALWLVSRLVWQDAVVIPVSRSLVICGWGLRKGGKDTVEGPHNSCILGGGAAGLWQGDGQGEQGLAEGWQVPQGLDDDIEEAVVLATHVAEAPHQLQAAQALLPVLVHQALALHDLPLSSCSKSQQVGE